MQRQQRGLFHLTCQPAHSSNCDTPVVLSELLPKGKQNRTLLWKQSSFLNWMWSITVPSLQKNTTKSFRAQTSLDLILYPLGRNLLPHNTLQISTHSEQRPFLNKESFPSHSTLSSGVSDKQVHQGNTWAGNFRGGPARRGVSSTYCTLTHRWYFPPHRWHPAPSTFMLNLTCEIQRESDSKCNRGNYAWLPWGGAFAPCSLSH